MEKKGPYRTVGPFTLDLPNPSNYDYSPIKIDDLNYSNREIIKDVYRIEVAYDNSDEEIFSLDLLSNSVQTVQFDYKILNPLRCPTNLMRSKEYSATNGRLMIKKLIGWYVSIKSTSFRE
jgi:hypothetical protein